MAAPAAGRTHTRKVQPCRYRLTGRFAEHHWRVFARKTSGKHGQAHRRHCRPAFPTTSRAAIHFASIPTLAPASASVSACVSALPLALAAAAPTTSTLTAASALSLATAQATTSAAATPPHFVHRIAFTRLRRTAGSGKHRNQRRAVLAQEERAAVVWSLQLPPKRERQSLSKPRAAEEIRSRQLFRRRDLIYAWRGEAATGLNRCLTDPWGQADPVALTQPT